VKKKTICRQKVTAKNHQKTKAKRKKNRNHVLLKETLLKCQNELRAKHNKIFKPQALKQ